jgi:DNA adenine methylase
MPMAVKNKLAVVKNKPEPFLKWAGGKRQLLPEINVRIPNHFETYFEPFLGGGALLFSLLPVNAVINDSNEDVINAYEQIKKNFKELIAVLTTYENTPSFFYKIRESYNLRKGQKTSEVERAAQTIYLNKTCYNGLYRVSKVGNFNTPFGRYKNPKIVDEANIEAVSHFLNHAKIEITSDDFSKCCQKAKAKDFVYLDPPYDPLTPYSSFTAYSKGDFSKEDQIRLKETCDALNKRGVFFMLSNSATPFIKDLYKEYRIETVKAKRNINSNGQKRGDIDEVLVRNY